MDLTEKVIVLIKEDKRTVWIKYPPGADYDRVQ